MTTPSDAPRDNPEYGRDNMFLISSGSGNFDPNRLTEMHEVDLAQKSRSAGKYVPSKGAFFEKRETRVDNERKRVTYILQTSGSHDRPRGGDDRLVGFALFPLIFFANDRFCYCFTVCENTVPVVIDLVKNYAWCRSHH